MSHNNDRTYWGSKTDDTFTTNNRGYEKSFMSQRYTQRDTMSSQYTMLTGHDNDHSDQKLGSITDDRLDSGIASMPDDEGISSIVSLTEEDKPITSNEMCLQDPSARSAVESNDRPTTHTLRLTDTRKEEDFVQSVASLGYESLKEDELSIPASEHLKQGQDEIDQDCLPFIPEKSGFSPLHISILDGDKEKAMDYIEGCPHPELLNFFTPEIHTALHLAVYANLPDIVRFLVVYGSNLSFKDKRGNTPFHTACELGRLSCAKMLLLPLDTKESIGLQLFKLPQDINEKNYEGLTPLHLATINDQSKVVNFLLSQPEININIGDSSYGRTALHHALERHSKECFYLLLRTSVNVNATTYDGCAPLHLAVGLGMEQETRSLMTRGANAYIQTNDDTRVWDLAKTQKLKDALQYSTLQATQRTEKRR